MSYIKSMLYIFKSKFSNRIKTMNLFEKIVGNNSYIKKKDFKYIIAQSYEVFKTIIHLIKFWNYSSIYCMQYFYLSLAANFPVSYWYYTDIILFVNKSQTWRMIYFTTEYFVDQEKYFYLILSNFITHRCSLFDRRNWINSNRIIVNRIFQTCLRNV